VGEVRGDLLDYDAEIDRFDRVALRQQHVQLEHPMSDAVRAHVRKEESITVNNKAKRKI
jgi:hypothetical protein